MLDVSTLYAYCFSFIVLANEIIKLLYSVLFVMSSMDAP